MVVHIIGPLLHAKLTNFNLIGQWVWILEWDQHKIKNLVKFSVFQPAAEPGALAIVKIFGLCRHCYADYICIISGVCPTGKSDVSVT